MPTFTPRLGLVKPLTTELYDISVANGNMDFLDAAPANLTICTSSTRPSSPDAGDAIFETDSLNVLVFHGGAWKAFNTRTVVCTNATRPASGLSFGGMTIFETDTGNNLVRNSANTAWLPLSTYTVANQTERTALVGMIEGLVLYRKDRDWIETYDGSGWRVQGMAVCSSTADRDSTLTTPYNGQMAFTTDTNTFWIRTAGSWVEQPNSPRANLVQTTAQSIANNTFVPVAFNAEDFDTTNSHDIVTNNSRYTIGRTGKYQFTGAVGFAANASGSRGCYFAKNGAAISGTQILGNNNGAGLSTIITARTWAGNFIAGDYVEIHAYQNSGGALLTTAAGSDDSTMSVLYIGA